ncbi:MAG: D-aminoacylase [Candidatus Moranbacteria bacterium]|nr:D-aminoacylase [Candidatus Moranbacteria bacterium]
MFDILIRNGIIIDGSGKAPYHGDIGIKGDKIKEIGELQDEKGDVEINADGRIICPGFIDVNNHSDTYWRLFLDPDLESLVHQGITTIIGGNCGSSLAPLASPKTIESIQKWIDLREINVNWLSEKEFLKVLDKKGVTLNFATLVGHGTLRRGLLGDEIRSLNAKEIKFLHKMLKRALKDGAIGMSSGLIYSHAKSAGIEELVELSRIVKDYDGVYATHMRSEQEGFLDAIDETVYLAKETGVKTHISHLKAMGESNWGKMDEALALLSDAKEKGADITFDIYPYTNTGSVLYTFLPDWVTEGGKKAMLYKLKNKEVRERVISEMKSSPFDYSKVEISISPLDKTLARRNIMEIAKSQEKGVEDAIIDILIASEGRVITSIELLSEENIRKALLHPLSMVATNGSGYSIEHVKSGEKVHPRSFGSFTKVLEKYVKAERILSWESAINKMTGFPAARFGIMKRGLLKEGYFADILMIDSDRIKSPATTKSPYQYSSGIDLVMINGEVALNDDKFAGGKNGMVLRR